MKRTQYSSNIRWLYIITFLSECYLTNAVWLFFYTRYLSFAEITTLIVMQQLVQLVFEIPTGAIADLLGKKKTLLVSYFLYFVSLFFTPFFTTFWIFFILEFIKGIAKALASGTQEALTYDSLKEAGKESEYPATVANISTISWAAFIPAGLIGGYLFDQSFYIPYLVLAFFYLIATIVIWLKIREPIIDTEKGIFSLSRYLHQTGKGFQELFQSRKIGALVAFLLFITVGYYTASEFLGISQGKAYGLSATYVSLLFTGGSAVSALLAQVFTRLAKKVSALSIAISASLFMLCSYLLALFVSPVLGMSLIVSRIGSRSTFDNSRSILLNRHITSKNRATALSTFSLLFTLPYVLVTLLGGKIIDLTSVNHFALYLGIFLTIGAILSLVTYLFAPNTPSDKHSL
jgi:MFS family permease